MNILRNLSLLLVGGALMATGHAQTESVTTTTTSAGTISEFSPDVLVLKTESSTAPIRYTSNKQTTYVDQDGGLVAIETIKSGVPVTVDYVKEGEQMVARRVIFNRNGPAIATTTTPVAESTTTTTAGTISEFSPNTIIVKSDTATTPVSYSYTKSTTYVDEAGAPVSIETVKSGLPVTVSYVKEGDHMVANRVVVRKSTTTTTAAPAAVIEKKTTTTTTTTTP
ncbi:MAG: hypothetical protein ABIP97_03315 [Chthoniobacterales bacterium]